MIQYYSLVLYRYFFYYAMIEFNLFHHIAKILIFKDFRCFYAKQCFAWLRLFSFVCHKNCHNKKPLTIKGSGSDYYITFSSFFNSFCTLALLHPSPPLISIQRLLHLKSLIAQKTLLQHPDLQPHCLSNRYSQSASLLAHNRITS